MYSFTELIARLIAALRKPHSKLDCLFCAHKKLALQRQPSYTCPRCKTVYKRDE